MTSASDPNGAAVTVVTVGPGDLCCQQSRQQVGEEISGGFSVSVMMIGCSSIGRRWELARRAEHF